MKSRTRLLAGMTLSAAVMLGAAGCGFGTDTVGAPPENSTSPEVPATEAPASEVPLPETSAPTDPATDGAVETQQPVESEQPAETPAGVDQAVLAAEAALAEVPGDVISLDREDRDVWSVEIRTSDAEGVELYVDAVTGEVQGQHAESLPREVRDSAPTVTAVEAIDIVLDASPEAEVRELDIDSGRGTVVWEVQVRDSGGSIEYYVDAATGEILKEERDD